MKIYITGCGRSGTTLLRRMFYSFGDVVILDKEISLSAFVRLGDSGVLVAKRHVGGLMSAAMPLYIERRDVILAKRNKIRLVHMMRCGKDVVDLAHGDIAQRWVACFEAYLRQHPIVTIPVFYEQLVSRPDDVQRQIAARLNLEACRKFSDYPSFVPESGFRETVGRPRYEARPLDNSGVDKEYDWLNRVPIPLQSRFSLYCDLYEMMERASREAL